MAWYFFINFIWFTPIISIYFLLKRHAVPAVNYTSISVFIIVILYLVLLFSLLLIFDRTQKLTQMNDSIAQDVKSIKKGIQIIVAIMLVQLIVVGLYIILVAVPVINKM